MIILIRDEADGVFESEAQVIQSAIEILKTVSKQIEANGRERKEKDRLEYYVLLIRRIRKLIKKKYISETFVIHVILRAWHCDCHYWRY